MKGFLNKVGGAKANGPMAGGKLNGEGKPMQSGPEGLPGGAKIESTPKADIMLPKKHDKRYTLSPCTLSVPAANIT